MNAEILPRFHAACPTPGAVMSPTRSKWFAGLCIVLFASACADRVPTSPRRGAASFSAVKSWDVGSSVAWNQTARDLIAARGLAASPAGQARVLVYLSVAQNNAIIAAEDTKDHGDH